MNGGATVRVKAASCEYFYLCPENWTWLGTSLAEVSDPNPWKEQHQQIKGHRNVKWNVNTTIIHWSLRPSLTLGRTPDAPANRHRKNLGTNHTCKCLSRFIMGLMWHWSQCECHLVLICLVLQQRSHRFHRLLRRNRLQTAAAECITSQSTVPGRDWLFSLAAVGVIHYHASAEACFHGLCSDQLKL